MKLILVLAFLLVVSPFSEASHRLFDCRMPKGNWHLYPEFSESHILDWSGRSLEFLDGISYKSSKANASGSAEIIHVTDDQDEPLAEITVEYEVVEGVEKFKKASVLRSGEQKPFNCDLYLKQ